MSSQQWLGLGDCYPYHLVHVLMIGHIVCSFSCKLWASSGHELNAFYNIDQWFVPSLNPRDFWGFTTITQSGDSLKDQKIVGFVYFEYVSIWVQHVLLIHLNRSEAIAFTTHTHTHTRTLTLSVNKLYLFLGFLTFLKQRAGKSERWHHDESIYQIPTKSLRMHALIHTEDT